MQDCKMLTVLVNLDLIISVSFRIQFLFLYYSIPFLFTFFSLANFQIQFHLNEISLLIPGLAIASSGPISQQR